MDNNLEIELYTPHLYQKPVHEACMNNKYFYIILICGRQYGKTICLINQSLYWVLNKKNVLVYWVSPTAAQTTKIYKTVLNSIIEGGVIKTFKGTPGDTEIIF